jgi:hypothetical protein
VGLLERTPVGCLQDVLSEQARLCAHAAAEGCPASSADGFGVYLPLLVGREAGDGLASHICMNECEAGGCCLFLGHYKGQRS